MKQSKKIIISIILVVGVFTGYFIWGPQVRINETDLISGQRRISKYRAGILVSREIQKDEITAIFEKHSQLGSKKESFWAFCSSERHAGGTIIDACGRDWRYSMLYSANNQVSPDKLRALQNLILELRQKGKGYDDIINQLKLTSRTMQLPTN